MAVVLVVSRDHHWCASHAAGLESDCGVKRWLGTAAGVRGSCSAGAWSPGCSQQMCEQGAPWKCEDHLRGVEGVVGWIGWACTKKRGQRWGGTGSSCLASTRTVYVARAVVKWEIALACSASKIPLISASLHAVQPAAGRTRSLQPLLRPLHGCSWI